MVRHRVVIAAGLALGLASLATPQAFAQTVESDDAAYCKKLASMYERWGRSANTSNSAETNTAIANCNNQRAPEAIAHLEKLMLAAGYSLPERAVGRRQQ
jgi:hypothetical protein